MPIALDIETDTTINGLDPNVAEITDIALWTPTGGIHLAGDEAEMIAALDELMYTVDGEIITWNGAVFDLPFIEARARHHQILLGLELTYDPQIPVKYEPTPGYLGGYRATWHGHGHRDISVEYRDVAADLGVKHSLKPVATSFGLNPVELDREHMERYSDEERREYVLSDARVTFLLAEIADQRSAA